jgi:hypothetical protein
VSKELRGVLTQVSDVGFREVQSVCAYERSELEVDFNDRLLKDRRYLEQQLGRIVEQSAGDASAIRFAICRYACFDCIRLTAILAAFM